jgi:hypothetical protein
MGLVNFAPSKGGTAASFGVFAIASSLGPTSIIDSIRTSLWHQSVFGSAYALKITMNNAYVPPVLEYYVERRSGAAVRKIGGKEC